MSEQTPERRQTADEVEQAGRLLMPQFQAAVRAELDSFRADFYAALKAHEDEDARQFTILGRKVDSLEQVKGRALAAWGVIVAASTVLWHAGKAYLIGRMERR